MFIVKNFIFKGAINLRSQHPNSKPTLLPFATCVQVAQIRAALYVTLASSTKGEKRKKTKTQRRWIAKKEFQFSHEVCSYSGRIICFVRLICRALQVP